MGLKAVGITDSGEFVGRPLTALLDLIEKHAGAGGGGGAYDDGPIFRELAAETAARQDADTAAGEARQTLSNTLLDAIAGRATPSDIASAVANLSAVARSGAYADLIGKPTIPTSAAQIGAETPAGAQAKVDAAVSLLLGGSPAAALDTIKELGDELGNEKSAISAITTSLAGKAAQGDLTAEVSRAQAAEKANGDAITSEVTRAKAAEGALLKRSNNLSDVADKAAARSSLELGSAALRDASAFKAAGPALPDTVVVSLAQDTTAAGAATTPIFSANLAVGKWTLNVTMTVVGNGSPTVDVFAALGTAVGQFNGPQATSYRAANTAYANVALTVQLVVTTAGTVTFNMSLTGSAAQTVKAQASGNPLAATGVVARCVSVP